MSSILQPTHHFPGPKSLRLYHGYSLSRFTCNHSLLKSAVRVRCCSENAEKGVEGLIKNYYELLGVSVDSTHQEIKDAYRRLQKKYHPDIAGNKGHDYTLMLNEAYQALTKDDLRRGYNKSKMSENNFSGSGCRECVHHASKTFTMDDTLGCARVQVQFGDDEQKIEVSVESCPMNCIHWVDREDLPLLEFLIHPQPKEAYGVFGGGWERPFDLFMAVKSFRKNLRRQQDQQRNVDDETPAQAKA